MPNFRTSGMRRNLASGLLLFLAVVSAGLVATLFAWGGRIEATLVVFGDLVFVTVDASSPRILFMLGLPIFLVVVALRIRAHREQP
jgi:hypothetical protein